MENKLNKKVFLPSSILITFIVIYAVFFPKEADIFFKNLQSSILEKASWFYILSVGIILISIIYIALSRYGNIKLGPDHSEPDYRYLSWFAMLFSAGMGIGLMFFGVAEPIMHYLQPPVGLGENTNAARNAIKITFFHWGLHAWGIYALVAVLLAFFSYRHKLPLTLKSALYPIIGNKINGPIGYAVDIFAVIGTLAGVATSLGYGVMQVNTGLNHLWNIDISITNQVILIIFVCLLATISVTSGLDKGIKKLSELNIGLAGLLLLFVLITGPTVYLLQALIQNVGNYISDIFRTTFNMYAYEKTNWLGGWTIFYWSWWIAWSPFVGLFIARISRGRTIREFVLGVLFIPTGFTFMWMTFFGNSGLYFITEKGLTKLGDIVSNDVTISLFAFLEQLPFAQITSVIAIFMIIIFFVTSADSGAMVIDMLCSDGNNNTPIWQRIYWSIAIGIIAIVLLISGGLGALQTMTIVSALPFCLVLLVCTYGLVKALKLDIAKKDSLDYNAAPTVTPKNANSWQERLSCVVTYPSKENINNFIDKTIINAMEEIKEELKQYDIDAYVTKNRKNFSATFRISFGKKTNYGKTKDFIYTVKNIPRVKPEFLTNDKKEEERSEEELYYCAVVYLIEGGQDYDVMGWSKEGIRNDIIDNYQKHMHFIYLIN